MKPGIHVAFIEGAIIQFGIVAAIIRRENLEGETTQVVVTSVGADGTANSDKTIPEDDVVDMSSWNKADRLFLFACKTPQYKWAEKQSEAILNPPVPVAPDPTPVPVPVPASDQF